ncbi:MAG: hypothetical protein RBS77_02400 [Candidatus Moranbacteria bacterium]|jgi:hypothetical protein|nr:hypothetical protein [Candidatus Moranbacteria bacterium]
MSPTPIERIQEKSRSIVGSGIFRAIIISLFLFVLAILILSEHSFSVVYSGIYASLVLVGIISIWVKQLRPVLRWILVGGAILYLGENIIVNKITPFVNNQITQHIPSYPEWRKTIWGLTDNEFGERTISMKKELMNSEINKGVFGIITENSPAYDEKGNLIEGLSFKQGQKIMSLGLQSKPQIEGSEGMAYVLIANEYGDFVNSQSVLVPIRKIEWESIRENEIKNSSVKTFQRETVGNFPVYLSDSAYNQWPGKNGERQGTGDIFIPHVCEAGYEYFYTISGEFEKLFWRPPFKKITWQGNDALAGQGVNKPFPNLRYGALTLRIGDKEGIFPSRTNGEIKAIITAPTPVFIELNINREIGEYLDTAPTNHGSKLRNSTLSIKIERRRLIE